MVRHDNRRDLRVMAAALAVGLTAPIAPPAMAQDATRGAALMRDSAKGNCSICHLVPGIGMPVEAQGNLGPSLEGVGARLSPQEIIARVTNARTVNPETIMPPYGSTAGLVDVDHRYRGSPILGRDEIADIATYLAGLK